MLARFAHLTLFRHPTLDGWHPTLLADDLGISKQTVNDLFGDLETLGYIRREVDPADKRSRAQASGLGVQRARRQLECEWVLSINQNG